MITEQQADTVIALLTEIRDELQRPRLEVARLNAMSRERQIAQAAALAAAQAADAAERAQRPVLWAGGAGIPTVRGLPPGEVPT